MIFFGSDGVLQGANQGYLMKLSLSRQNRIIHLVFSMLMVLSVVGCRAGASKTAIAGEPTVDAGLSLAINGFNYTNRDISQFLIDDQGGGSLRVSGPDNGGGGSVCCFSYHHSSNTVFVNIRWQSDACTYITASTDGTENYENLHSYFKEARVQIEPLSKNPKFLAVHFFPDGRVRVATSETPPLPLLSLQESRAVRHNFLRCPNGKKPD